MRCTLQKKHTIQAGYDLGALILRSVLEHFDTEIMQDTAVLNELGHHLILNLMSVVCHNVETSSSFGIQFCLIPS